MTSHIRAAGLTVLTAYKTKAASSLLFYSMINEQQRDIMKTALIFSSCDSWGSSANRRNLKIGTTSLQCIHIPTWVSKSVLYIEQGGCQGGVIGSFKTSDLTLCQSLGLILLLQSQTEGDALTWRTSITTALPNKKRRTKKVSRDNIRWRSDESTERDGWEAEVLDIFGYRPNSWRRSSCDITEVPGRCCKMTWIPLVLYLTSTMLK